LAVDVIGDIGKSVPNNPPKNRLEYGEWLVLVNTRLSTTQEQLWSAPSDAFHSSRVKSSPTPVTF
jgi:hypothetical protein